MVPRLYFSQAGRWLFAVIVPLRLPTHPSSVHVHMSADVTFLRLGGPHLAISGLDALRPPIQVQLSEDIRNLVIKTLEKHTDELEPWTKDDVKIQVTVQGVTEKCQLDTYSFPPSPKATSVDTASVADDLQEEQALFMQQRALIEAEAARPADIQDVLHSPLASRCRPQEIADKTAKEHLLMLNKWQQDNDVPLPPDVVKTMTDATSAIAMFLSTASIQQVPLPDFDLEAVISYINELTQHDTDDDQTFAKLSVSFPEPHTAPLRPVGPLTPDHEAWMKIAEVACGARRHQYSHPGRGL